MEDKEAKTDVKKKKNVCITCGRY